MIISYSGDAVQRGLGLIPDQVFVNWSLPAEVGAVKVAVVSGELAKDMEAAPLNHPEVKSGLQKGIGG